MTDFYVIKRSGLYEKVSLSKLCTRMSVLGDMNIPCNTLCYRLLAKKIMEQMHDNIKTSIIDELCAEYCASMSSLCPEYGVLASRLMISNNHKNSSSSFVTTINSLFLHNSINEKMHRMVTDNDVYLQSLFDYSRDYLIDYFGYQTLKRSYLLKNDTLMERPQHMWMRVAICIHGSDLTLIKETYDIMSCMYFTHATPTLYNAGNKLQQLSSCFLMGIADDSIDEIFNAIADCARISKLAGGIGLHISNIRAAGSKISTTNGVSGGIVNMMKVFNSTARYIDQGGKRPGSFAVYLEPWHADIEAFLDMKRNHGDEDMRARDLFYALWVPDLFMEMVKIDGNWSLFCPNTCPGLSDCYGTEFNEKYNKYVNDGKSNKILKARTLWMRILDSQMETGTPYILYKDAANRKSNQQNLGVIKSSNLCTEIIEFSSSEETAVCNLASIGLPKFVGTDKLFDYDKLHDVVKVITTNLNKVIDVTYYPIQQALTSNLLHRPIGIGVQGLADVFAMMNVPYDSMEARQINRLIFETIYHASLERSNEISMDRYQHMRDLSVNVFRSYNVKNGFMKSSVVSREYTGGNSGNSDNNNNNKLLPIPAEKMFLSGTQSGAYSSFNGSPASFGVLQFDMWANFTHASNRYDWVELKKRIVRFGLRNSLLVAPMPTASTSQILGNNECTEPFTSNIYLRRTNAGEFVMVNKHLVTDLIKCGAWNEQIKDNIILNKGSIQQLTGIPSEIKNKFKTAWEIPPSVMIDMAADRGPYICQSQSMNLWVDDPNYKSLTTMHFAAWRAGLKTGIYYLRRRAKHQAQQFTIQVEPTKSDGEACDVCSS